MIAWSSLIGPALKFNQISESTNFTSEMNDFLEENRLQMLSLSSFPSTIIVHRCFPMSESELESKLLLENLLKSKIIKEKINKLDIEFDH